MNVRFCEHDGLDKILSTISYINTDTIELEKDRIVILKKLHAFSTRSNHLIAKLLLQQDKILKKRYQDWKLKGIFEEYTQPKSIYQWINLHKDVLGFGEKQARRYLQLHEDTEENPTIGEKLGTKKNDIIRSVPRHYRDELRQKTIDQNWSATRVEKEVYKIKEKEKKTNTFKKIKPQLPSISIRLDKKNKNKIIIEVDPNYRDTFNSIFQEKYIQKIRHEMYSTKNIVV